MRKTKRKNLLVIALAISLSCFFAQPTDDPQATVSAIDANIVSAIEATAQPSFFVTSERVKVYGVAPGMDVRDALRVLDKSGWTISEESQGSVHLEPRFVPAGCRTGDSCHLSYDSSEKVSKVELSGIYVLALEIDGAKYSLTTGVEDSEAWLCNRLGTPEKEQHQGNLILSWEEYNLEVMLSEYGGVITFGD